jgi:hypothetical protein
MTNHNQTGLDDHHRTFLQTWTTTFPFCLFVKGDSLVHFHAQFVSHFLPCVDDFPADISLNSLPFCTHILEHFDHNFGFPHSHSVGIMILPLPLQRSSWAFSSKSIFPCHLSALFSLAAASAIICSNVFSD